MLASAGTSVPLKAVGRGERLLQLGIGGSFYFRKLPENEKTDTTRLTSPSFDHSVTTVM